MTPSTSLGISVHAAGGAAAAEGEVGRAAAALGGLFSCGEAGGAVGFLRALDDTDAADRCVAWAESRPAWNHLVVVGMGGSAQPSRIMNTMRSAGARPRLTVLDTVDPDAVELALARAPLEQTLLLGISKSGGTLETRAVFDGLASGLRDSLGADEATRRIAVVCGPVEDNPLGQVAVEHGYARFDVPLDVGGRYSALTPVGLLPAAILGVDPHALLAGGRACRGQLATLDGASHPALTLAASHLAWQESGRLGVLAWTYSECLTPIGAWWVQLVAESLGKRGRDGPEGPLAFAARGPADQHSLLQRLLDGPNDTLVNLVHPAHAARGPCAIAGPATGHPLGTILHAQALATADALAAADRPVLRTELEAHTPEILGAYLTLWHAVVGAWGAARGIDPYDQPAVARGKAAVLDQLASREPTSPSS